MGTVNKVGQGHIGLLVFGVFNASISYEYAKSYHINSSGTGWEHKTTGEILELGSDVSFVVKGFVFNQNCEKRKTAPHSFFFSFH